MPKTIDKLSYIAALISKDVSAAEKELKEFCEKYQSNKDAYTDAKLFLIQMTIAVIRDTYTPNDADEKKALNFFNKKQLYDDAANLLLSKARHFFVRGQIGHAEEVLQIIQRDYLDKISIKPEIIYLTRMSFLYMRKQDSVEQLNICLQALEKLDKLKEKDIWYNNNYTIFACNIANLYIEILQFEEALPYLEACLKIIAHDEVALYNKWNVYHYLAHYYGSLKDTAKAIEWSEKQIELLKPEPGYHYLLYSSYINAAQYCYILIRDGNLSKRQRDLYLTKQRDFVTNSSKLIDIKTSETRTDLLALSRLECQSGNYELAANYIQEVVAFAKKNKQQNMEQQCYREAHHIYSQWGKQTNDPSRLIKAYEYLLAERNITEQLARINHKEKLDAVTNKYELKQKALSEKLAQQEIDALKKEVQAISFNLSEKIQVLDDLKVYVKSLKKKELEVSVLVSTISKKIDMVKITEQDKASIQYKLSEGKQKLSSVLSAQYPVLSSLEINLCTMFETGLTNRELARLYGQTEKSYEQHRYRIKKKMGLSAKDNLVKHLTFLNGI